jgi:hypothetical protein
LPFQALDIVILQVKPGAMDEELDNKSEWVWKKKEFLMHIENAQYGGRCEENTGI